MVSKPPAEVQAAFAADAPTVPPAADAADAIPLQVQDAFAGRERPWHSFITGEGNREDLPEAGTSSDDGPFSAQSLKQLGAYLSTSDPKQLQEIFVSQIDGVTPSEDAYGNPTIDFKGKQYYLNRPGFSEADAFTLLADIGLFSPGGAIAAGGKTLLRRLGLGALLEGGTQVAKESAAVVQGAEVDLPDAAARIAGVAGGAGLGDIFGSMVGRGANRLMSRRTNLQPYVRRAFANADLDFDALPPEAQKEVLDAVRGYSATQVTKALEDPANVRLLANRAGAIEFGVPATRGQISGSADDLAMEARQVRDPRTPAGQRVTEQPAGLTAAVEDIAPTSIEDASTAVQGATRARIQELQRAEDAAWAALDTHKNVNLAQSSQHELTRQINDIFRVKNVDDFPDDATTSRKLYADLFKLSESDQPILLGTLLDKRKEINRRLRELSPGTEKFTVESPRLQSLKEGIDLFIGTSAERGGQTDALGAIQSALSSTIDRATTVARHGAGRRVGVGPLVTRDIAGADSPEQVAQVLFGSSSGGGFSKDAAAAVSHLQNVLPSMDPVKDIVLRRTVFGGVGAAPRNVTPASVSKGLDNLLTGKGADVSRRLFSPEELAKLERLQQYSAALKQRGSTDPSGWKLMEAAQKAFPWLVGGGAAGASVLMREADPAVAAGTGLGLGALAYGVGRGRDALRSRAATAMPTLINQMGGSAFGQPVGAAAGEEAGQGLFNRF